MDRRRFLQLAAAAGVGVRQHPKFRTANSRWQVAYDRAFVVVEANVRVLPRYGKPVLIEGANYAGIWLGCGPHEALVYRKFRADVARNSHDTGRDDSPRWAGFPPQCPNKDAKKHAPIPTLRGFVPTSLPLCMAGGSRSPPWQRQWEKPRRRTAGPSEPTRFAA
jgi:hypothetical protein